VHSRSRYWECIKRFAMLAPSHPVNVVDIREDRRLLCLQICGTTTAPRETFPGPIWTISLAMV